MSDYVEFASSNVKQKLTGKVVKLVYPEEGANESLEDGNKIFLLKEERKPVIKVHGYGFPVLHRGDIISVEGFCEMDEYGNDIFSAYSVKVKGEKILYRNGTKEYLCQIEGIGPALSGKIIAACGEDIIEKMQKDPNSCSEAEAILPAKVYARLKNKIARSTPEKSKAISFLLENEISSLFADRIWRKYREDTIEVVKKNPYRLITDIMNFDFNRAEKLANHMVRHGFKMDSPYRVEATIMHALSTAADEDGHSFLKKEVLINFTQTVTPRIPSHKVIPVLNKMIKGGVLIENKIADIPVIYTKSNYTAEADGAEMLKNLIATGEGLSITSSKLNKIVKKYSLDDSQKSAVLSAIENPVSIITGGPGTGKTTTMKAIIEALTGAGIDNITLCSFTGKASRRMAEVTGREASTIHRLLEWDWNSATFRKNKDNQLSTEAVIIDEVSMVNAFIFYSLLLAIKPGTRLLMIGDDNQLPAIGPGNVLHDCVSSGVIPTSRLTTIHRRSEDDMISVNAAHILAGEPMEDANNFKIYDIGSSKEIIKKVMSLSCGLDLKDSQILTPTKKNDTGTKSLNERLQAILNPDEKTTLEYNDFSYRPGDKVMQMKNDYSLEVMNGEWGIIKSITGISSSGKIQPDTRVVVDMDPTFGEAREVEYDPYSLFNLRPAYACTIHKTQGSEYGSIAVALPSRSNMLNKNLIYTAVTRARDNVAIIGKVSAINEAINNDVVESRNCAFAQRLKGEI